jgi:RNA polymerase subunit RPABC4/transcription elongation factor Spt4
MSLKPCPDCGVQVSGGAESCPACGKRLKTSDLTMIAAVLIGLLILGAFMRSFS